MAPGYVDSAGCTGIQRQGLGIACCTVDRGTEGDVPGGGTGVNADAAGQCDSCGDCDVIVCGCDVAACGESPGAVRLTAPIGTDTGPVVDDCLPVGSSPAQDDRDGTAAGGGDACSQTQLIARDADAGRLRGAQEPHKCRGPGAGVLQEAPG